MKYFTLVLSIALAFACFSCLEEESFSPNYTPLPAIERPDDGRAEIPREQIDASEVAGLQFSMAEIVLKNASEDINFSMPSCYLSVFEAECDSEALCQSRLDEGASSFTFNNTYRADPDNDNFKTLSFNDHGENGTQVGSFGDFLRTDVYPIIGGDYDFKVYRQENKVILECSDCPMVHGSQQEYDFRRITLTLQ